MIFHEDNTIPSHITDNMVWVSGSNLCGRHGKGAAKIAKDLFGATYGVFNGLDNRSYHIPTKPCNVYKVLSLEEIVKYVNEFKAFTFTRPDLLFIVTRVGCGLAGYSDEQIAPMFKGCNDNCSFAKPWQPYLED